MPFIADKSADMILCDLPYGITSCKWDKVLPLDKLWHEYNRIIKDNGAIVLTATCKFAIDLINANRRNFRYDLIWEKTMAVGFANSKRMPMRKHEIILVFYRHLPVYNPQGLVQLEKPVKHKHGKVKNGSGKHESVYRDGSLSNEYITTHTNYPKSILRFANPNHGSLHPTQKPVELFEYLIRTYTNEGDLVLDNCIGSGTTAVACLNTGRRFVGIERDEGYYSKSIERIKSLGV
jgi:site-specific DNA-methyltransferase (adenine-specific)